MCNSMNGHINLYGARCPSCWFGYYLVNQRLPSRDLGVTTLKLFPQEGHQPVRSDSGMASGKVWRYSLVTARKNANY